MKKIFVLIFFILSLGYPKALSQTGKEYLSAAEKIAAWLAEQEYNLSNNQSAWPISNINKLYNTGISEGSSGIGMFYIKLYKSTKKSQYLQKAIRAGNLTYEYSKKNGTNGPDWLAGAAGSGDFLVSLYLETKDTTILNKARYFGDYLINTAYSENGGYYWKHGPTFPKIYTGFAHGAAGIGFFLLRLYEVTSDNSYLDAALKAMNWLKQHYLRLDNNSIGWKRLTTDDYVYNHWCGGSVGIMTFIDKLYEITQKIEYLNLLKETANGFLLTSNKKNENSLAWPYSNTGGSLPVIYCHGTSSLAVSLFSAYKRTNDQKYLDAAIKGLNWIDVIKKAPSSNHFYWDHIDGMLQFDTGLLTGTAGVGEAFLESYKIYNINKYHELAVGAADYLLSVAETPKQGQTRWINYIGNENANYDTKQYYTGWYSGAAGIGIFLLELYETFGNELDTSGKNEIVTDYRLSQNYPNPFNSTTIIQYQLPNDENVSIKIYDVLGKEIATLLNKFQKSGDYRLSFKADDYNLSTGVYYYCLKAGATNIIKKMLLMK